MPTSRIAALATALVAVLTTVRPAHAQSRSRLDSVAVYAAVEAIFGRNLAAKRFDAAAVVIIEGDRVVLKRGYGWTDRARRIPVDPDSTVFSAASVSKVFAATALVQLADRGQLDLSAPIAMQVNRIHLRGAHAGAVTAEHLLTHTAGLDAKFLGALAPSGREQPRLEDYFLETPPAVVRKPGSEVAYSNIGAALQGYLVEAVAKQPFYEYVEQQIFTPLGMTMSSFRQPLPDALAARRPTLDRRAAPFYRPYPAASLVTTSADMGRFLIALLNGGQRNGSRVLSERALRNMLAPHWRAQPTVPGVALGLFESFGPAGRALFHTGDGGHHSLLYLVPEQRFGLYAVYACSDDAASQLREELADSLVMKLLGGAPPAPMPPSPADFASRAAEYVGTYRSNSYSHFNIEKIGVLPMQLSVDADGEGGLRANQFAGDGEARLVETAHDVFRTSDGGYAAFRRDERGRVMSIVFSGSVWDPSTANRLAWHQRARVQLGAALLAGLVVMARLVAGGAHRLRRRRTSVHEPASMAWRLSGAYCVLMVTAPLIAPLGLFTGRPPYYAAPWSISLCLLALLVGAVLGAALLWCAWRERSLRGTSRWQQSLIWLVAAASVATTTLLWNWNLLRGRA